MENKKCIGNNSRSLMRCVLTVYCSCLLYLTAFAQVNSFNKDIIPPSPSSAVYNISRIQAPSLVTGSARMSIPLCDLKCGNISLPFTLDYNSNGIKVYDDPSPCGYGWIFSPGLRITRTIMGRPDEQYPWQLSNNGSVDNFTFFKNGIQDDDHHIPIAGLIDTQHDIFRVSLWDKQCTFILKRVNNTLTAITQGNSLKIVITENPLSFEVTDENGIKYLFRDYVESLPTPRYTTAWMLQKMTLLNGEEILFEWKGYTHMASVGNQFGSHYLRDSQDQSKGGNAPEYTSSTDTGNMEIYGTYGTLQHLSRVKFPAGEMNITYKVNQNPFIESISIKNGSQAVVNTINFAYGTTTQDSYLLKKVTFLNGDIYSFGYNPTYFSWKYAQDYWGYYNGKTSNRSLVPLVSLKTYRDNYQMTYNYELYGNADRSIHAENMKANMLTRVDYPTGGYTLFEYEPHRFTGTTPTNTEIESSYNQALNEGGGLRVTKITTKADVNAPEVVKTYKYGPGENGLAVSLGEPTLDTFLDVYQSYSCNFVQGWYVLCDLRQVIFNASSSYMAYNITDVPIWYDQVTEYTGQGKTVYTFAKYVDRDNIYRNFGNRGITYYNTLFSKGPLLKSQIDYKLQGGIYEPVKRVDNSYIVDEKQYERGLLIRRRIINTFGSCGSGTPDFEFMPNSNYFRMPCLPHGQADEPAYPDAIYDSNPLDIGFKCEYLSATETTTYTPNGNFVDKVEYTYENSLLKTKKQLFGTGGVDTETYFYPFNYASMQDASQRTLLQQMVNLNILSTPFLTTYRRNGVTQEREIWFKNYGNNMILPEKEYEKKENNAKECRVIFEYDKKGNIQAITRDGALKTTYLWGYNWQYPIVKVEGAGYSQVVNAVAGGQTVIDSWGASMAPNFSQINALRTSASLNGAMVSTYTYKPLTGVLSETNPVGLVIYYSYDSSGRLIEVYLMEGTQKRVLEQYNYHYRNQ